MLLFGTPTPRKTSLFINRQKKNKLVIKALRKCGVDVGDGVTVVPPFNFDNKKITIGRNVFINADVLLISEGGVVIGENSLIGPRCTFCTSTHFVDIDKRHSSRTIDKIIVGENVWIGAGVTILPGVKIGNNSVIGAGSLVKDDVPENHVYAGVPAKKIKAI